MDATFDALIQDVTDNPSLLPARLAWDGSRHNQTLHMLDSKFAIPGDAISTIHTNDSSYLRLASLLAKFQPIVHIPRTSNIASNLLLLDNKERKFIFGSDFIGSRYQKLVTVQGSLLLRFKDIYILYSV
jgi:hypothetical protein